MFKNLELQLPENGELETYFDRLWPICRSITGTGLRESLRIIQEVIPLELESIPTGTAVFDWAVPEEWEIKDAYIKNEGGERVVDFKKNNLHVLGYSTSVDSRLNLDELQNHLYSLPEQPDAIPYLTSYYKRRWGFCLKDEQRKSLAPGKYHVKIDARHFDGKLDYGHAYLASTEGSKKEILISTYLCHPSMANNELSGPLLAMFLYRTLKNVKKRHYNLRFVFVPETIGSIVYLSRYGKTLSENLVAGFVATSCGDDRNITYKKSKRGDSIGDLSVIDFLKSYQRDSGKSFDVLDFYPTGSDERQYCSPGFNLPVGSLMRSQVGKYPEYHTSLDTKNRVVTMEALRESIGIYAGCIQTIDYNHPYKNLNPFCEPQLGKRGLYPTLGSQKDQNVGVEKMMNILAYSDGTMLLSKIAEKMRDCSVLDLAPVVEQLKQAELLAQ